MNILQLQPTGVDVVTFWTSEEKPEGAFIQFPNLQTVFGVVALQLDYGKPFEVGLLKMPQGLYQLVAQINDEKKIHCHDMAFISDPRHIMCVAQKGGMVERTPEVTAQLEALHQRLTEPGIGEQIMTAARGW